MALALQAVTSFTCGLVIFLGLVAQAMSAGFVFYKTYPGIYPIPFGQNVKIDCSTNGTNVTTELFKDGVSLPSPSNPAVVVRKDGDIFTIADFGISDSGTYKCRATDGDGKTIEWPTTTLLIPDPNKLPDMSIDPKMLLHKLEGGSANFTCKSAIQTELTWYKVDPQTNVETKVSDDKIVTVQDPFGKKVILMIKNAKLSDSGDYKCVLNSRGKQKYELTALKVLEIIPIKMVSFSPTRTAVSNTNVRLECIVDGNPVTQIKWFKGDKEVAVDGCDPTNDNYKICGKHESSKYMSEFKAITRFKRYNGTLVIRRTVYPSDRGIYQCRVGEKDQIQKADIFVDIHVKPILSKKEGTVMVSNVPVNISCRVEESNPAPTWSWQFQKRVCIAGSASCDPDPLNWKPLPKTIKVGPNSATPSNISTIYIPKDQKDSFYQCFANNSLGSDSFIKILLRNENIEPIKIKDSKVGHVYTAGLEPIKIECKVIQQYAPIGVLWYKDGKLISISTQPLDKINTTLKDTYISLFLTIDNTTTNDTGEYSCVLRVDPRKKDSVQVTVKARVAPDITGLVSQQVKIEDMTTRTQYVELQCDTVGANPPPKYTWYFTRTKELQSNNRPLSIGANLDSKEDCHSRTGGYYYLQSIKNPPLVICKPSHSQYTGWYHCKAENIEGTDIKKAYVNILEGARIIEEPTQIKASLDTPLNITCTAAGNPLPDVIWTKSSSGEVLAKGKGKARLHFAKLLKKNLGNYTCNATNYKTSLRKFSISRMGSDVDAQTGSNQGISQQALVGIICGCVVFVLIVTIICLVVYRRQKKQIEEYKELYFLRTGNSDYKIDPDRSLLDQCNDLPYDLDWEFPEERLILGKPLGAGAFGQVLKAEAIGMAAFSPRDKGPEAVKNRNKLRRSMRESSRKKNEYASMRVTKTTVAVKTLKEGATQNDYKDLASELKILIHLGNHKNIVNILGACTRGRRLMVIIEFAPHGDLLSFLRQKRDIYEPNWIKTSNNPEQEFTLVDLAMAAYQISRGMEFLASRKCVHRDLAARNVLVGKDFVMKISDFGLARDIYKDDLYVKTTSGLLPVKWMAMESLFDRVYTEKSDVWAFGIVLWEIFTLGGNPYPGLPTEQLLDYLSEGQRMKQPQDCPLEMYAIMRDCWMQFPDQRPEFEIIAERLGKILERNVSEDNPYLYLETDEGTGHTDYYLNPCDTFNTQGRQTADGYEEALPTPRPDTANKYDSPLPTVPPDSPGYEGPSGPLPSIPPTYEEATMNKRKQSQSSNESGIGFDDKDKDRDEKQPLMVHLEDETSFSPGKKGQKRTTESSV